MQSKTLLALGCAAAASGLSASAEAAPIVFANPLAFSVHPIPCDVGNSFPCSFTATGSFARPAGANRVAVSLYTTAISPITNMFSNGFNVNFNAADLNGSPFTFVSPDSNITEVGFTTTYVPLSALNTITITGTSGGDGYIYGDLLFASPEPAAWALMLLGFAGIGGMIRRRRTSQVRARMQFA